MLVFFKGYCQAHSVRLVLSLSLKALLFRDLRTCASNYQRLRWELVLGFWMEASKHAHVVHLRVFLVSTGLSWALHSFLLHQLHTVVSFSCHRRWHDTVWLEFSSPDDAMTQWIMHVFLLFHQRWQCVFHWLLPSITPVPERYCWTATVVPTSLLSLLYCGVVWSESCHDCELHVHTCFHPTIDAIRFGAIFFSSSL